MGLNEAVNYRASSDDISGLDGGPAVVHIQITTLVLERLSASDVMKSIMSTIGKEVSRRSEDGTESIIQFSC